MLGLRCRRGNDGCMIRAFFIALLLSLVWASPAFAQVHARAPMHVELVLDTSGSMEDNDRERLSALAGMVFADLAAPNDFLGIQSLQRPNPTLEPLTRVGPERDALRRASRTIQFKGATFCEPPLEVAARELRAERERDAAARQFVIFFSDGLCEDAVEDASTGLRDDGVTIFSIGLFDDETLSGDDKDHEASLKLMKSITGGEYFRVESARELPNTFARVLGRIVGSEARPVPMSVGETRIDVDPYVLDAMLVVTHESSAVRATRLVDPGGKALDIPIKSVPYTSEGSSYFVSAAGVGKQHYTVLRLEDPTAGPWRLILDGAKGARAVLVQNYALVPVLELDPRRDLVQVGKPVRLRLRLQESSGEWIDDPDFAGRVKAQIEVYADGGTQPDRLKIERNGSAFEAEFTPAEEGVYRFESLASMESGLNKASKPLEIRATTVELNLVDEHQTLDFGTVKAGDTTKFFTLVFEPPELDMEYPLKLSFSGDERIEIPANKVTITRKDPGFETSFVVNKKHPGGEVSARLDVSFGSSVARVDVHGRVEALTFWEVWGDLVLTIGLGLLMLIVLALLIYGWVSPHSFPANARFVATRNRKRIDDGFQVFRDIPGTGKFFFRNARLKVGGTTAMSIGVDTCIAIFEARGPAGIHLSVTDGFSLEREIKFSDGEFEVIESGEVIVKTDRLYRVDEFYLAVK